MSLQDLDGSAPAADSDIRDSSPAASEEVCDSDDIAFPSHSQSKAWNDEWSNDTNVGFQGDRPRREAHSRAVGINTGYFVPGGALDSQTSETQFVSGLFDESQDLAAVATTNEIGLLAAAVSTPQPVVMTLGGQPLHPLQISPTDENDVPTAGTHLDEESCEELQGNMLGGSCVSGPGGYTHGCHCTACFNKLKQVNIQLRTHLEAAQLRCYEYCGRWTLASARVCELEGRLTAAGILFPADDMGAAQRTIGQDSNETKENMGTGSSRGTYANWGSGGTSVKRKHM